MCEPQFHFDQPFKIIVFEVICLGYCIKKRFFLSFLTFYFFGMNHWMNANSRPTQTLEKDAEINEISRACWKQNLGRHWAKSRTPSQWRFAHCLGTFGRLCGQGALPVHWDGDKSRPESTLFLQRQKQSKKTSENHSVKLEQRHLLALWPSWWYLFVKPKTAEMTFRRNCWAWQSCWVRNGNVDTLYHFKTFVMHLCITNFVYINIYCD